MELIAKANRQIRKFQSVTRISASEERQSIDTATLSLDTSPTSILTCALHNGPLCNPRRLPCSHSFCYQCLNELQLNRTLKNRIICPICRASHEIDNIDDLYVDYSLMKRLNKSYENTDDAGTESLSLDASRTIRMLKDAENACDGAITQIRQMNADVSAMKMSLTEKRKGLEAKFNAAKSTEDNASDQRQAFTCLGYDCNFMKKTMNLAENNVFSLIREINVAVHHTTTLVKGAGLFNIWLKEERPLSEHQLKQATQIISEIWLTQDNPHQMCTDEDGSRRARGEFAKRLALSFRSHFSQSSKNSTSSSISSNEDDDGVWTAIVGGRKLLDFYVYSHKEFYICVEIQKTRIVVYRCVEDASCLPVDPGRPALFETFVRNRLDDALKRSRKEHNAIRPARFVSESLKTGLGGGLWHCVGGPTKTYAIHTTGERDSQTVVTIDGCEYGVWQCNCAAIRKLWSGGVGQSELVSPQVGQTSQFTDEVEYDEPYCLD